VTGDVLFSLISSCRWEKWPAVGQDVRFAAVQAPPKAERGGGIGPSRFRGGEVVSPILGGLVGIHFGRVFGGAKGKGLDAVFGSEEAEGVPMNQSLFDMTPKELRRAVRVWAKSFAYAKARDRGFDDRWSEMYADFAWKFFKKQAIGFLILLEFERQQEAAQWQEARTRFPGSALQNPLSGRASGRRRCDPGEKASRRAPLPVAVENTFS
jgi:hypothetical protein